MEDKYNELKARGKTENEAIGVVISEFGNMDELAEELGLNCKIDTLSCEEANVKLITNSEARTFLSDQSSFAKKISIGVILCILSIMPGCIADVLFVTESNRWVAGIFGNLIFVIVAIAAALFINTGVKKGSFEQLLNKGELYGQ